jgi:N-acetyl-anhydromuramyl-L-alanine amidase AmpD
MDETGALWRPSPNYFPKRLGHRAKWIIIHGTAGFSSAEAVGYDFQHTDVATHYIIGRDGTVIQSVGEEDGAYGNGFVSGNPGRSGDGLHHDPWWTRTINPNNVTISIEHVKPGKDNSDELTEVQKHASFLLIEHICQRHSIPRRYADESGGITGHFSMDPINRSFCPGPYPWAELFAYLRLWQTRDARFLQH